MRIIMHFNTCLGLLHWLKTHKHTFRTRSVSKVLLFILTLLLMLTNRPSLAGLLNDNDARKAILELRTEVRQRDTDQASKLNQLGAATSDNAAQLRQDLVQHAKKSQQVQENIDALKSTLLELNNVLTQAKESHARLSGQVELLANAQQTTDAAVKKSLQIQQNQIPQLIEAFSALDARVKKLEPRTLAIDGQEATVERTEEQSFNSALAQFKATDYAAASQAFSAFIAQYSRSELLGTAYFWLGNSRYANREPKAAIAAINTLLQKFPQNHRVADASLTLAQSYEEIGDTQHSQETYQMIIKKFPNTPAALAAHKALPTHSKKTTGSVTTAGRKTAR
jgi:tol-pal system protein YbgF